MHNKVCFQVFVQKKSKEINARLFKLNPDSFLSNCRGSVQFFLAGLL